MSAVHHDRAALHHPSHIPDDYPNIPQWIAFNRNDIRKVSRRYRSQALLHAK
jgi:hypothetical protein